MIPMLHMDEEFLVTEEVERFAGITDEERIELLIVSTM